MMIQGILLKPNPIDHYFEFNSCHWYSFSNITRDTIGLTHFDLPSPYDFTLKIIDCRWFGNFNLLTLLLRVSLGQSVNDRIEREIKEKEINIESNFCVGHTTK